MAKEHPPEIPQTYYRYERPYGKKIGVVFPDKVARDAYFRDNIRKAPSFVHGGHSDPLYWNLPDTPARKKRAWKVCSLNNWLASKGVEPARIKAHQRSGRVFVDRYPLCTVVLQVFGHMILHVVAQTFTDLSVPFTKDDLQAFYDTLA